MNCHRWLLALLAALVTAASVQAYDVTVTGRTYGAVWGTDIYTNDSDVATAAVHYGLIAVGQTATIRVTALPGQSSYTGSTRNGVTTYSYGSWGGSYSLSLVSANAAPTASIAVASGATLVNGQWQANTGATVGFTVSASDPDGVLSSVVLERQSYGNFTAWYPNWANFSGSASIFASSNPETIVVRTVATDNAGSVGYSGWLTVTVVAPTSNQAPVPSISGPTSVTVGDTHTWTYSATDADSNIYRIRLNVAGAPGNWTYGSGSSLSSSLTTFFNTAGTHSMVAEAEDTQGAVGSKTVYVTASAPSVVSVPYTVSCSYPYHSSYPSGAPSYAHLTDGSQTSGYGYGSDSGAANWLKADFGSTYRMTKIHVGGGYVTNWATTEYYSSGAVLEVSSDNVSWTPVHTFSSGFSQSGTTVSIDATGRYFRLSRSSWLGTTEFRFEGSPASTPTYTLTVSGGSSGGQTSVTATAGTVVALSANAPPYNHLFAGWTLSGAGSIQTPSSSSTNYTFGSGAATATATTTANSAPTAEIDAFGSKTVSAGATVGFWYRATDANSNLQRWRVSLLPAQAQWTSIPVSSAASAYSEFNYTFPNPGTYTFELQVEDSLALVNVKATVTITVQAAPDTTPPTAPSGLAASGVTSTSLGLAWNAATDNVGVTGYRVYRGGSLRTTVTGLSYSESGLSPSTNYQFEVRAIDAAGNQSGPSNTVSVTTQGAPDLSLTPNPVEAGGVLRVNYTGAASTSSWIGLYGVGYANTSPFLTRTVPSGGSGYVDITLTGSFSVGPTYEARLFVDLGYTVIATSPAFTVRDTTAPSAPGSAAASNLTATTLTLTWTASSDFVGVTGYRVFRGGSLRATVTSGLTYAETGLTPSTAYQFDVKAIDAAGNQSGASNVVSVTTPAAPDTTPPTAPASLLAENITQNSIDLRWSAASDAVGVTAYRVYRGGVLVHTVAGLSVTDPGLTANTTYTYVVRAIDAANNLSDPSNTITPKTLAASQTDTANQNQLKILLPN